jgi:predicted  nucleic acid-binding Zn-ribbon protein
LFEELVSKGEKLEANTKDKFKEKTAVEKRVEDVRKKLGLDSSDTDTKIDELSQKVDALTEAVNKMS